MTRLDRESIVHIFYISIFFFVLLEGSICCTVKIVNCRTVAHLEDNRNVRTGSVFKSFVPVCITDKFICALRVRYTVRSKSLVVVK